MERFFKSKLLKMVTVIAVIFSMIAAYLPANSNADETPSVDYVAFDVQCNAGSSITSGSPIAFGYDWTLSGVQTGFKNVKLTVKDEDTEGNKALARIFLGDTNKLNENNIIINQDNGRYSTVKYGSVRNGTNFAGTASVSFKGRADFEDYQKTITFILEADYKDPIEGVTKHDTIEKTVTVTVQSADEVDSFSANVQMGINKYDQNLLGRDFQKFEQDDHLGVHYAYYNSSTNYAIDKVAASYNVNIDAENVCYGQYQLKLQKQKEFSTVATEDLNSEENMQIDLSGVPSVFATQVNRNNDGTTDIILTFQQQKDTYTVEDMVDDFEYNFNIRVIYNIYYSYSVVMPVTSTKTITEVMGETITRTSPVTQTVTDNGGRKIGTGTFNSATTTTVQLGEGGEPIGVTTYTHQTENMVDDTRPYFVKAYQTSGKLVDSVKIANVNGLNGLRLAEGEGNQSSTSGTIASYVEGLNHGNNQSVVTEESGKVIYTDVNQISDTTRIVTINETEDKIVTKLGSWVTITGRYTAQTEGLDLRRNKDGVTIEKKSANYSNSSNCTFLSASTEGKCGTHYEGESQQVNTFINTLNSENKIKANFITKYNLTETATYQDNPSIIVTNYNTETGTDAFEEHNSEPNMGSTYATASAYPTISYRDGNTASSPVVTEEITTDIMKVNSITITEMPAIMSSVSFYKRGETTPFFVATSEGDSYQVPDNTAITEYYAKVQYNGTKGYGHGSWNTEWEINKQDLTTTYGWTEENIKNIFEITRKQFGIYGGDVTTTHNGIVNINNPDLAYDKISYIELSAPDFNTTNTNFNKEPKTVKIKMYKNNDVFRGTDSIVYNVNPTVYLQIPAIFEFENINVTLTQNPYIYIKNTELVTAGGNKYIKIECEGTYNSSILANAEFSISFIRSLKDSSATQSQTLRAFVLTDNENYYSKVTNTAELTQGSIVPANIGYSTRYFTVEQSKLVQAISAVVDGRKSYIPNSEDGKINKPEKEFPLIISTGKPVTFVGELKNTGKALTDVNLLYKLPVDENLGVKGGELLEDDYSFPNDNTFITKYASSLNNPVDETGKVNHLSRMINLNNIKVYKKQNAVKTLIDPSEYTIYYSNDIEATLETDIADFTAYNEQTSDVTNATAILVHMNNVAKGENITVEYTMQMPNEAGMVGTEFGAKYTQQGDETATILDSEPVYLINGNDLGSLEVQKVFEGYVAGVVPTGINFSDIQFKLKDENGNYVQNAGVDVVATANSVGTATFTNLPAGTYQLEEITQENLIPGYDKISNLIYPVIDVADTTKVTATNPKKRGSIVIHKKFEDTNEVKGRATFQISRKTVDSINFETQTITSDAQTGVATIVGIPYGTYTVKETSGIQYYGIAEEVDVVVDETTVDTYGTVEQNITNPIGKGTLVINKTVPANQSVRELTFNIKGLASLSYVNTQGQDVVLDKNITIDLSQDYSSQEDYPDIDVQIASNNLSAVITLTNLPLGLYTITETNIPKINQESQVKKYVDVTRTVELRTDDQTETVNIINRKKVGYLAINKTAFVGDPANEEVIADKSAFKVRVTGTSYYGTVVDTIVSLDEDGKAQVPLEIGTYTVKETPVDGYDIYYKNDQDVFVQDTQNAGKQVEVEFNDAVNKGKIKAVDIQNLLTGEGYVRVEKSLEGITNPTTVANKGIKFKITGRNAAGTRVEQTININQIDINKNVAYGVSEALSVGGEYELEEVATTVPEYFEGMESRSISVTTSNTISTPLVIPVTNNRGRGKLEMVTKTDPAGGTLTGITYKVTEIEMNSNGTYVKLDGKNGTENTVQNLTGSNGVLNPSFAQIEEAKAGYYLVELEDIPLGYNKDLGQIVEVPTDGTGVAVFTITPNGYKKYTQLTINKKVLNTAGEPATAEDYAYLGLEQNQSFEVKLTNTVTGKQYVAFISENKPAVVYDLPGGTYIVEEQYKPKYSVQGYYNVVEGIQTSALSTNDQEKYIIQIQEGTSKLLNSKEITIVNALNPNTPPGGSSQIDNMSKINTEQIEIITQTIVNIVDEEGNALPGAKFKLMKPVKRTGEGGVEETVLEEVNVGTEENVLTSTDNRLVLRGLDVGKYVLVNTSVPEGYLQPENKEIFVYADVTQVSRIEIQKNIPRGALTLSTKYLATTGDLKNVPSSKYKVVNPTTGEVVKFVRTATGDYKKSNLEDAVEVINVKSREVVLSGLEAGTYEVGLVGVTNGYALLKEYPETVQVVADTNKEVVVEVQKPKIVQVKCGYYTTIYLDESGTLWNIGSNNASEYGDTSVPQSSSYYNSIPHKITFPEDNVVITDFDLGEYSVIALDSQGRVWGWGNNGYSYVGNAMNPYEPGTSQTPVCLTNIDRTNVKTNFESATASMGGLEIWSSLKDEYEKNNVKIVDVEAACYNKYLLDSNGKLWSIGNNYNVSVGANLNTSGLMQGIPKCISDIENNPLYEAYNDGIKLVKLANINGHVYNNAGAIDSLGRVWMWGYGYYGVLGNGTTSDSYEPVCISEIESEFTSAEIVDLAIGQYHALAVDSDGNAWVWGSNSYGQLANTDRSTKILTPQKLSSDLFGGARIVRAFTLDYSSQASMFIDEYGRIWACGYNYSYRFSNEISNSSNVYEPICMSDMTDLGEVELTELSENIYASGEIAALDKNGTLWGWAGSNSYGQIGGQPDYNSIYKPRKIAAQYTKHLEYNLKFKRVYSGSNCAFAIDEHNKLWACGNNQYAGLGKSGNTVDFTQIPELCNEEIVKFIYNSNNFYLAITDTGKVYVFGSYISYSGIQPNNGSSVYVPTELTPKFNLSEEVKFVDGAVLYEYGLVLLDSEGKVWVIGNSYGNSYGCMGVGTTSTVSELTCISDDPSEALHNAKIKKLASMYYYGTYCVDENGKVWFMGGSEYSGLNSAIRSEQFGSSSAKVTTPVCLTDIENCEIGEAYEQGTRFIDVKASADSGYYACLLDNTGKVWDLYPNTSSSVKEVATEAKEIRWNPTGLEIIKNDGSILFYDGRGSHSTYKPEDSNTMPNDAIDFTPSYSFYSYCIDSYGQIWQLGGTNPRNLAGMIKNKIYGIKMRDIIQDGIVEADSDRGEIYSVSSTDSDFVMFSDSYLSNYLGVNVVQLEKKNTTSLSSSYYIALDDEGKLWTWGGNSSYMLGNNTSESYTYPICISNIENTELNNAYINDENFKITSFEVCDNFVIAYDSNGKMWTWGNNANKQLGNGTTTNTTANTPVCITNVEGDLKAAYAADSNFKFTKHFVKNNGVYAIDNHGDLWTWGNTYTANGTTTPKCLSKDINSHLYIEKQTDSTLIEGIYNALEKGESLTIYNGKLWALGCSGVSASSPNYYGQMGVGYTGAVSTITCLSDITGTELYNEQQADPTLRIVSMQNNTTSTEHATYALDSKGRVWSWGAWKYGQSRIKDEGINYNLTPETQNMPILGTGATSNQLSPVCLNNQDGDLHNACVANSDLKIEKIEIYDNCVIVATDNTGNLWVWGRNNYGELGNGTTEHVQKPYCITSGISGGVKKYYYYSRTINYGSYVYEWRNGSPRYYKALYDYRQIMFVLDNNGNMYAAGGNRGYKITHAADWLASSNSSNKSKAPYILGFQDNKLTLTRYTNFNRINDFQIYLGTAYANARNCDGADRIVAYGRLLTNTRLYTWGYNGNRSLGVFGYSSNTYYYVQNKDTANTSMNLGYANIEPDVGCYIENIGWCMPRVVRMSSFGSYGIDYDNKLWYWGQQGSTYTSPVCLSTNANSYPALYGLTFTEIETIGTVVFVIDNNGKLWRLVKDEEATCLTDYDYSSNYVKGKYFDTLEKTIYTGTYKKQTGSYSYATGTGTIELLKARDNTYYTYDSYLYPVEIDYEITPSTSTFNNYTGDLAGKTVVDYTNYMAIDSEGNLYGRGAYDGLNDYNSNTDFICITATEISRESAFKTNNIPANIPIGNDIYGKKVEELYNDRIVKTEDGTYWYFPETGNVINLSNNLNEQINPLYGKEIVKDLGNGYILTSDNKIYSTYNEAPEYVMDYVDLDSSEIEDSILDFSSTNYYIVLDKYGKVWTCGSSLDGQLGNGSTKDTKVPVCISDIEGTDLYNEYQNNPNFKIEKIYCKRVNSPKGYGIIALDSNGKLWSWGYNYAGELGNNTAKGSSLPICISNIAGTELAQAHQTDSNMKMVEIIDKGNYKYALDYKGRVWRWGDNSNRLLFTGDTVSLKSPSLIQGPEGIKTITDNNPVQGYEKGILHYKSNGRLAIIIDNNGKVWTAGDAEYKYNNQTCIGKGTTTGYSTFECLADIQGTELYNEYQTDPNFKIVDWAGSSSYDINRYRDNYGRLWIIDNTNYLRCYYDYADLTIDEICTRLNITKKTVIEKNITIFDKRFIILDTNGKIWSFGRNTTGMLGTGSLEDVTAPICISDIAGTELNAKYSDPNFKIEEIYEWDNASTGSNATNFVIFAKDSDGKLWSWGSNSFGIIGRESTAENQYVPTCISDINNTELYSKHLTNPSFKIESVVIGAYNMFAIDNEGKLWSWGYNYEGYLADNTTNVATNTNQGDTYERKVPKCLSDITGTEFANAFISNSSLKIVKIINPKMDNRSGSVNKYKMYALDNTGHIWGWGQVVKSASNASYPEAYNVISNTPIDITNMNGTAIKTAFTNNSSLKIVDINKELALDNEGNVWVLYSEVRSYDDITFSKGVFNNVEADFKIVELEPDPTSGGIAFDVKDNYDRSWYRKSGSNEFTIRNSSGSGSGSGSGSSTVDLLDEEGVKTIFRESFNIELEKVCISINTTTRRRYYAVDENGKVWVFDSASVSIPQCITDNQDLPLYTKLNNNPNFKIIDIYNTSYMSGGPVLALDNEGKVWEFPNPKSGTYTVGATCISETQQELSSEYSNSGFKINKMYCGKEMDLLIDSNGEVWTRGDNPKGYGYVNNVYGYYDSYRLGYINGNGSSNTITTEFKRVNGVTSVVDIVKMPTGSGFGSSSDITTVVDSNGKRWTWGNLLAPHFDGYANYDALVESTKTGIVIAEVLDETHIKDENGNVYEISNTGEPNLVSITYQPQQYSYAPVTLEGVNVVKNTNFKALDSQGNLYVWTKYTGGYQDFMPTSKEAVLTTDREYIVEPEVYQGNGWSEVKANY